MVRRALIHDQAQAAVVQTATLEDCSEFLYVVDHATVSILPSRLRAPSREENAFRPAPDCATLPDNLAIRRPQRWTLQQHSAKDPG